MFIILTCVFNAENYIGKCIDSIKSQKHNNFKSFIIDDMSTDNTKNIIRSKIENDDRFTFIENTEKKYKLRNFDEIIRDNNLINDEDIIVELDGDDWFINENSLSILSEYYLRDPKLWLTNGSFIYSSGYIGFSSKVNYKTIRQDAFTFSHLRSWKSHLWRKIKQESFMDTDREYFKIAADVAYSLPMVEIAGEFHYTFIPEILCVYNEVNPINDHKEGSNAGGLTQQLKTAEYVRRLPKYVNIS